MFHKACISQKYIKTNYNLLFKAEGKILELKMHQNMTDILKYGHIKYNFLTLINEKHVLILYAFNNNEHISNFIKHNTG